MFNCIYKFQGRNKELAERLNKIKKPEQPKPTGNGLPDLDNLIDEKIWFDCCHPVEE